MNEHSLKKTLSKLNLGGLRYFETIGSTNDEALAWAVDGARDFSLVIADEQTSGRGRLNRKWFTPAGSALALSLILRPDEIMCAHLSRVVGLAALSIADACNEVGLSPRIKWPNDILIDGKKVAGILIENIWSGDQIDALVIGMGVNVLQTSIPPESMLMFPATSLETALGQTSPEREAFVLSLLSALLRRRENIGDVEFLQAWEENLAFRGEQVNIRTGDSSPLTGELIGLEADGSLRLRDAHNNSVIIRFGDVSLRPAE